MPRYPYPLPRGGRGPQIGPGTFDCRSSTDATRPQVIDHIVWSRGSSSPDVEIWCFLTTAPAQAPNVFYRPINPPPPQPPPALSDDHYAWLDQVPDPEAFVPPTTQPPMGNETELALKSYAVQRMATKYDLQTGPGNWTVRVGRPFPSSPLAAGQRRFGRDGVFQVVEDAVGVIPTAWVWVALNGKREVWALHRLGLPGGFAYVGLPLPATGQPLTGTRLAYRDVRDKIPIPPGQLVSPDLGDSMNKFIQGIVGYPGSPVTSADDLEIHDYRVGPDV